MTNEVIADVPVIWNSRPVGVGAALSPEAMATVQPLTEAGLFHPDTHPPVTEL
jgi:hypothetical protein